MKAIEFPEVNLRIAEDQDEYMTLPAYMNPHEGSITSCFELDDDEIEEIVKSKKLFIKVLNFGQPMQPISLSVIKEHLIVDVWNWQKLETTCPKCKQNPVRVLTKSGEDNACGHNDLVNCHHCGTTGKTMHVPLKEGSDEKTVSVRWNYKPGIEMPGQNNGGGGKVITM